MTGKPPKKFMPHTRMREIFGDRPDEYFSASRMDAADRVMDATLDKMEHKALEKLQSYIGQMQQLVQHVSGARPEKELDAMAEYAFAIKCHAGMYDYPLASQFANQLFYYSRKLEKADLPSNARTILEAYVAALNLIFKDKVQDMQSPAAVALLKELDRLGKIS